MNTPVQLSKHSLYEPGVVKSASNILSLLFAPGSSRRCLYLCSNFLFLTVTKAINPDPAVTVTVYLLVFVIIHLKFLKLNNNFPFFIVIKSFEFNIYYKMNFYIINYFNEKLALNKLIALFQFKFLNQLTNLFKFSMANILKLTNII